MAAIKTLQIDMDRVCLVLLRSSFIVIMVILRKYCDLLILSVKNLLCNVAIQCCDVAIYPVSLFSPPMHIFFLSENVKLQSFCNFSSRIPLIFLVFISKLYLQGENYLHHIKGIFPSSLKFPNS